jgi:hypothetical protein
MLRLLLVSLVLLSSFFLLSASVSSSIGDVTWLSASSFNGVNYEDGMPAGNGRVVVLGWANISAGSLDFYVRSPLAMHTDTQLYTIARVSIAVQPNPFSAASSYFNQTSALADGSITVLGGGTSFSDYVVSLTLWVDANSDSIFVSVVARDGVTAFNVAVNVESVRAKQRFTYGPLDFQCQASSSGPDVFENALPTPAPPSAIAIFHVNDVSAGDTSLFNASMHLQGLASLLPTFSDPLNGRIFGLAAAGGAGQDGTGAPLMQTANPGSLASTAPSPAFLLRLAILVNTTAGGDVSAWLQGVAGALVNGPAVVPRKTASDLWWTAFWNRSWITLPPSPPPGQRIGVAACGGADAAAQRMMLNVSTGEVRLPGNLCFSPDADGEVIAPGPCNSENVWIVTPCTAAGCNKGEFWVRNTVSMRVLGFPGANCPWIDDWTVDDPTGVEKNELWVFNASDSTLRTLCLPCAAQCITAAAAAAAVTAQAPPIPSIVAAQYARTRFVQAVQSRGVDTPIKFNGMLFTSMVGFNGASDVDYRQWSCNHWWQNTRLPYGAQMAAGDFDTMAVILDWVSGMLPLIRARSQALLGFDSFFMTETEDIFGLYQGYEYGCNAAKERPEGYPVWLEGPGSEGGWVRYDFGGNGVGLEAGLMSIDYCVRSLDAAACAKYVPIATASLDFYIYHYQNRTVDGKFLIWPTQVLESYWCEWPGWTNCCENDLPQLAGVTALAGALLDVLPATYLTAAQIARYTTLREILPGLPLAVGNTTYAAAWVVSSGDHNSEVPELYASHPFRLNTVGRAFVDPSVNLNISRNTWQTLPLAKANTG